jgi:hypothetical protein
VQAPAPVETADTRFARLPSAKLLTQLLEDALEEIRLRQLPTTVGKQGFPALGNLWDVSRAYASKAARDRPPQEAAVRFLEECARLDRRGDPLRIGWQLSWIDANERKVVVLAYLVDSGLLELREAQVDSPKEYLSERELGGTT